MTNIESVAKQDLASARSGLRAWMANHPFLWGAITCAVGAFVVVFVGLAW
ncbi:MAG TPA: hypothetical protein VGR79_04200 [Stellaceae bacterium]|nr:hypothetical protein [Stellaceae bacterium]